jgi:ketopantoate hydroxymethyltransferase
MLTTYNYPLAKLEEEAGVDMILVGDSGGMVKLGYSSTIPVSMDGHPARRLPGTGNPVKITLPDLGGVLTSEKTEGNQAFVTSCRYIL